MKPEQIRECADQLVEFHKRLAPLFYEKRQAHWCYKWLHGFLLDGVRKNAAKLARAVPGANVQAMQQFITDSPWDHRKMIAELQLIVADRLADPDAVVVVDDTGFAKKGQKSVGVKRQYSGTLGKVDNCQVGVFAAYVSRRGHCLVDEELYLPKEWARDRRRRKEAGVPKQVAFQSKPQLALQTIKNVAGGAISARWVACDDAYGESGQFRDGLDALGLNFMCEVPSKTKIWTELPPLVQPGSSAGGRPRTKVSLSPEAPRCVRVSKAAATIQKWRRITARQGTKRPIRSAWAALRVYPWRDGLPGAQRWLVVERRREGSHKYFLSNAPADTPLEELVRVAKQKWFVEQCFRDTKQQVGLSHFEVRKWAGWHHHMTMCMLAYLFLVLVRAGWKKGLRS